MKLLFLLLLLPACIQAQNFRIEQTNKCKCSEFNLDIYAVSLDSTVSIHFRILDNLYPWKGDSLLYNGKTWLWKHIKLHLYQPADFIVRPAPMKAYSPAGNYLESLDSNHFKVYYLKTDTIERHPIACRNSVFPSIGMLYIIDGFKTHDNKIKDSLIFGKNLLSVKVYKDADATVKYGSAAANGATEIITYKKKK